MTGRKNLVLAAMVFAVAMTFIDQTIVAIAIPKIQKELSLSPTGAQWVINSYLLALSALFAFGGKLGDVLGRRRMVLVGVAGFALASAACGFTPKGSIAEAWIIFFRAVQGATAALLFPASVAIVVASFPVRERGKAMAIFFGISGGLTAIGPIAGGFLTQWTWRSIFWINIPVAIVALVLTRIACPEDEPRPEKLDYRGTALITGGMALIVLGFEQSSVWGWGSVATWACIVIGLLLLVVFVRLSSASRSRSSGFRSSSTAPSPPTPPCSALMSIVFVPFFFFGSVYAQVALGKNSSQAGEYILWFFVGFVIAAQVGGRILDRRGARPSVLIGSALGAVGFYLLAGKLTDLSLGAQRLDIALAGAGLGLMLGPASTDAVNRAPSTSYSEVTGITQTARNFGASLGLAVLGAILISAQHHQRHRRADQARRPQRRRAPSRRIVRRTGAAGRDRFRTPAALVHDVQLAFAHSTQTVFYIMAGVLAATFIVTLRWLPRGRVEHVDEATPPAPAVPDTIAS